MEYIPENFADGSERANTNGQAADHFGNTEQSHRFSVGSIMHALENENSIAKMAQMEALVPPGTLEASASMNTSQSKAAKGAGDEANWERRKKRKIEMEDEVKALTQKNKKLEDEIRTLKAIPTRPNQASQSGREEVNKLKHQPNQLMTKLKNQAVLVNILLERLAGSDLSPRDEEIQKQKNETDLLRQGMGMDSLCLQLVKENAELKNELGKVKDELEKVKCERKALEFQLGAVCEKIIAENPSP